MKEFRVLSIFSQNLKREVKIYISLPKSYFDSEKTYPVLYMHDGNNLFDKKTSFGGNEWNVDETCEKLMSLGKIKEAIIVGAYNNKDRMSEYTPVKDPKYWDSQTDRN